VTRLRLTEVRPPWTIPKPGFFGQRDGCERREDGPGTSGVWVIAAFSAFGEVMRSFIEPRSGVRKVAGHARRTIATEFSMSVLVYCLFMTPIHGSTTLLGV
jgi:hypothetical protein